MFTTRAFVDRARKWSIHWTSVRRSGLRARQRMLTGPKRRPPNVSPMNLLRFTLIDHAGAVSFVADADVLPALLRGCQQGPSTSAELLHHAESYYHGIEERVLNGLAMFDERNVPGHYEAVHQALAFCAPHEQPPFRVVDDETREASLRPAKAGVILFNLARKRIVQIHNSYREITRRGRGRVYDGKALTRASFEYRLPGEWQ